VYDIFVSGDVCIWDISVNEMPVYDIGLKL
jgi:hypothetical protein